MNGKQTCLQCKGDIHLNDCQQGQLIDGTFYPLHIGCADVWCSEKIPVYVVENDEQGYTTANLEDVFDEIRCTELLDDDDEQSVTVTIRKMARIAYLKLPEI